MSRKTRIRLVWITVMIGSIALVITGVVSLKILPIFPQVGVISIVCGIAAPFLIPIGIKNANRKADEAEMLAEWRKQRDKQQPRR